MGLVLTLDLVFGNKISGRGSQPSSSELTLPGGMKPQTHPTWELRSWKGTVNTGKQQRI
jgi:hypothetical protein